MNPSDGNFVDPNTDNLDEFEKLLRGEAKELVEEQAEDDKDVEDDTLATDEDLDEDKEEVKDEADKEPDPEPDPEPKKKSRYQERIDELTDRAKTAERREEDLMRRLQALEEGTKKEPTPEVKPLEVTDGPGPDDKNDDGSDKYPLGEFDPTYIRDLTRFTIKRETEEARAEMKREDEQHKQEAARTALTSEWSDKLSKARETYPDLTETNSNLEETFRGIEPSYGEYLANTIMQMDFGVDVLHYLGNNIEEAKRIAASGPTKATIALGRLEARFADANSEKTITKPRISQTPAPPPSLNKGSTSSTDTPDDTEDLNAFEKKFYIK